MSEYEALKTYLASLPYYQREAAFSFEQLEKPLSRKLPPSARTHRPWWGNEYSSGTHSHAQAWIDAGWKVDEDTRTPQEILDVIEVKVKVKEVREALARLRAK